MAKVFQILHFKFVFILYKNSITICGSHIATVWKNLSTQPCYFRRAVFFIFLSFEKKVRSADILGIILEWKLIYSSNFMTKGLLFRIWENMPIFGQYDWVAVHLYYFAPKALSQFHKFFNCVVFKIKPWPSLQGYRDSKWTPRSSRFALLLPIFTPRLLSCDKSEFFISQNHLNIQLFSLFRS